MKRISIHPPPPSPFPPLTPPPLLPPGFPDEIITCILISEDVRSKTVSWFSLRSSCLLYQGKTFCRFITFMDHTMKKMYRLHLETKELNVIKILETLVRCNFINIHCLLRVVTYFLFVLDKHLQLVTSRPLHQLGRSSCWIF